MGGRASTRPPGSARLRECSLKECFLAADCGPLAVSRQRKRGQQRSKNCLPYCTAPAAAGLAVSAGALVGLDAEEAVRRARDPLRLAQRRFSDLEIADLKGEPFTAWHC